MCKGTYVCMPIFEFVKALSMPNIKFSLSFDPLYTPLAKNFHNNKFAFMQILEQANFPNCAWIFLENLYIFQESCEDRCLIMIIMCSCEFCYLKYNKCYTAVACQNYV